MSVTCLTSIIRHAVSTELVIVLIQNLNVSAVIQTNKSYQLYKKNTFYNHVKLVCYIVINCKSASAIRNATK